MNLASISNSKPFVSDYPGNSVQTRWPVCRFFFPDTPGLCTGIRFLILVPAVRFISSIEGLKETITTNDAGCDAGLDSEFGSVCFLVRINYGTIVVLFRVFSGFCSVFQACIPPYDDVFSAKADLSNPTILGSRPMDSFDTGRVVSVWSPIRLDCSDDSTFITAEYILFFYTALCLNADFASAASGGATAQILSGDNTQSWRFLFIKKEEARFGLLFCAFPAHSRHSAKGECVQRGLQERTGLSFAGKRGAGGLR